MYQFDHLILPLGVNDNSFIRIARSELIDDIRDSILED